MGTPVLGALLTIVVLLFVVLCDAQAQEDSHLCVYPFTVPETVRVAKKCRRGGKEMCTKIITQYVRKMRTSCCEGWVVNDGKCVADCKRGCTRGTCIAPDVCKCDPPLILKNNVTCEEPSCNPSCVNANCVADDTCVCEEGFTAHNETHCIPICPEGFINDPDTFECTPQCDNCINGNCTAPNTCTCYEGYILQNSSCVPYCHGGCKNGRCVAPDTCECNAGYSTDALNKLCRPICEEACINATCVEPNKCACLSGYENVTSSACRPKCDVCNNGECVAPNQCDCLDGYSKLDGINCSPICSKDCVNGYCIGPNRCACKEGFILSTEDQFNCVPTCEDGCVNATCVSPNFCNCNSGYEKLNDSICRPFCSSCEHGVCVSPDNCQCHEGFERINGTCQPVCSSPCVNGFCESPEQCTCNDGYMKYLTESVCYKPCAGGCENGQCNIDGECLCHSGYQRFNSSCVFVENCDKCNATCPEGDCRCENGRPCNPTPEVPAEAAPSTSLAGLQMTWLLGGCVGLLLVTIVIITISYIWKKRKEYGKEPADPGTGYSSVLYTIPNTLIPDNYEDKIDDASNENEYQDAIADMNTNESVSVQLLEEGEDKDDGEDEMRT